MLDNSAPTGGTLTVNGGNAYSTSCELPGQPRRLHRRRRRLRRRVLRLHGRLGDARATAPAAPSGSRARRRRHLQRRQRHVLPVHAHRHRQRRQRRLDLDRRQGRHDRSVAAERGLRQPLERQHVRQRRRDALLPAVRRRHVPRRRERLDRRRVRRSSGYTFSPLAGFASSSQTGGSLERHLRRRQLRQRRVHRPLRRTAPALDSTDATYNVTADSTAPSGGGLTVNGTAATGGGSSSYFTSGGSVALSTTAYTDARLRHRRARS